MRMHTKISERFYVNYGGDYYPNPLGSLPNMFEDDDAEHTRCEVN